MLNKQEGRKQIETKTGEKQIETTTGGKQIETKLEKKTPWNDNRGENRDNNRGETKFENQGRSQIGITAKMGEAFEIGSGAVTVRCIYKFSAQDFNWIIKLFFHGKSKEFEKMK